MNRVYNFSAGPSMLPVPVLQKAQADLLDYHGSGMSVMEMSHRSKWFDEIIQNTEAGIRKVLNVPDNYKIGFFQGGATIFSFPALYAKMKLFFRFLERKKREYESDCENIFYRYG